MNMIIETVEGEPDGLRSGAWRFSAPALAPGRMISAADDTRWLTRWSVARSHDRILGAVTSRTPRSERFINNAYDLGGHADLLGGVVPDDPRRWVFVGSSGELAAGALISAELPPGEAAELSAALVAEAFGQAEDAGNYPVALFVRDREVDSFAAGLAGRATVRSLATTAELHLTGSDEEEHTAALPSSQRARCRRDRRKFAELGHLADCVPAEDVITEAAPLVCAVKRKYGAADHPRLCEYRLRQWARALGPNTCRASIVRDTDGELLAVSFFAIQDTVLESYEIGLVDEMPGREYSYLQAMIHGPVQYALKHGCRSVDLGLDSPTVKERRGAAIGTAWAISPA
ncbi:GNAT family N-acetyltransferase [Streptomyces johnsoniae]|uniref:GNAT family N-acetyltransferase n=1 Tax=Streptomyces johnsoniae TaxID=3075532 RepID=A0ABU2SC61_9ACTN|nr:GNAT family N-acetyltransferase [Streptomyces sp. DSM 41886]MDT0445424.1 GNAT family N-acetyltransferase [Streptomyces sp. DSM 41886]